MKTVQVTCQNNSTQGVELAPISPHECSREQVCTGKAHGGHNGDNPIHPVPQLSLFYPAQPGEHQATERLALITTVQHPTKEGSGRQPRD
eukprot:m.257512 g.257512  ORF g.257512 m.257512 type:complete len:90 (+) comp15958_c0_seq16:489-758(+)